MAAADGLADELGAAAVVWTGVTTEDHDEWSSNYQDWHGYEPNNYGGNANYDLENCVGMVDRAGGGGK